jgi:hypothetical protein
MGHIRGTFEHLDPTEVPLPSGTKVTTRVDRLEGERRIPQGAVGRVVQAGADGVLVKLADGTLVRYLRRDVIPTKLGQLRFAVRRDAAWSALVPCAVLVTTVGSRAWGLADERSDTDRRGVFVLPFTWTTSLAEPPGELVSADGSETYWEVEKALRQGLRADPNTLETLFLPSATACDALGEELLGARDALVSREIYGSFGRYALSQLAKLRQSLRLADHRHLLLGWLRSEPDLALDAAARRLAVESGIDAPSDKDALERARSYIKQLYASLYDQGLLASRDFPAFAAYAATSPPELDTPRQLRPKNAYNLLRLIASATTWLTTGQPEFEVRGALRERLLAIKRGDVALDDVLAMAHEMMPALDAAREASPLPAAPDLARADAALRRIREEAARRHFAGAEGPFGTGAPAMPEPSSA